MVIQRYIELLFLFSTTLLFMPHHSLVPWSDSVSCCRSTIFSSFFSQSIAISVPVPEAIWGSALHEIVIIAQLWQTTFTAEHVSMSQVSCPQPPYDKNKLNPYEEKSLLKKCQSCHGNIGFHIIVLFAPSK